MFTAPATSFSKQAVPMVGELMPGRLPSKGLNYLQAPARQAPDDAYELVNATSDANGITLRNGYQFFATNLPAGLNVYTMMAYYAANVVDGKLFACIDSAIYDVTAGGAGAWTPESGITSSGNYWSWLNFQNAAGNYLTACCNSGRYAVYNGTAWAEVTMGGGASQISGVDPDTFVHVNEWGRRLWFVEQDSTRAWYLAADAIYGAATAFDFGPLFRHGGTLVSTHRWTVDGGEGVNDYFVAIGSKGDIVVYKGYDPDSAGTDPNAFMLHGVWYVGDLPPGHRQAISYAGELYILSHRGISQMSKIVASVQYAGDAFDDIGTKIDPKLAELMVSHGDSEDWYMSVLPIEQLFIIGTPNVVNGEGRVQYVMKQTTGAWSKFNLLPVVSWVSFNGSIYGGGAFTTPYDGSGSVLKMFETDTDGLSLDGTTAGEPVIARVTPSFQAMSNPGYGKRPVLIRPTILAKITPGITLTVLSDFRSTQYASTPALPSSAAALWNRDLWNQGYWGGNLAPIRNWLGIAGFGFSNTVQIDIAGLGGTVIANIDFWIIGGGPL